MLTPVPSPPAPCHRRGMRYKESARGFIWFIATACFQSAKRQTGLGVIRSTIYMIYVNGHEARARSVLLPCNAVQGIRSTIYMIYCNVCFETATRQGSREAIRSTIYMIMLLGPSVRPSVPSRPVRVYKSLRKNKIFDEKHTFPLDFEQ